MCFCWTTRLLIHPDCFGVSCSVQENLVLCPCLNYTETNGTKKALLIIKTH